MIRAIIAASLIAGISQPTLGCLEAPPPVTPMALSGAKVAFIGTVVALGERDARDVPDGLYTSLCRALLKPIGPITQADVDDINRRVNELRKEFGMEPGEPTSLGELRRERAESAKRFAEYYAESCTAIPTVVFHIDAPIRGIEAGGEYEVPQIESSCYDDLKLGMRYAYGDGLGAPVDQHQPAALLAEQWKYEGR